MIGKPMPLAAATQAKACRKYAIAYPLGQPPYGSRATLFEVDERHAFDTTDDELRVVLDTWHSSNTVNAGERGGTVFVPVLLSGSRASPRSKSTHATVSREFRQGGRR